MYKKLFLPLLSLLTFSCNNDDSVDDIASSDKVLVSRTIEYTGQLITINRFVYENNKLVSVGNNKLTNKEQFIYDGDKIVRSNSIQNNVISGYTTMIYEGNNLKSVIPNDDEQRFDFQHTNSIMASRSYSSKENNDWVVTNKETYIFENGNMSQIDTYNRRYTGDTTSKSTYTYDSKNNPMRDMPIYIKSMFSLKEFSALNLNNAVTEKLYNNIDSTTVPIEYVYDIIYNDKDFPIEISKKIKGNTNIISKVIFEYK